MNIKLILILTFYLALLLMLPIDAQRNRNRMIRIRNGFRRNGWRNNIAKLRELISFYQYGVDLNDAMRRSDLVRDVVETLENRNMRPLPIRGKYVLFLLLFYKNFR